MIFGNLVLPMLLFWCSFVDDFLLSTILLLNYYKLMFYYGWVNEFSKGNIVPNKGSTRNGVLCFLHLFLKFLEHQQH
jgi:hypothetical protein